MNRDLLRLLPGVFLVGGFFGACGSTSEDNPNPAAKLCADGIKNQDETDVDCGGASCKACVGAACMASTECGSGACSPTGECVAPGTRVCGVGFARKCDNGETCATGVDCTSTYCTTELKCAAPDPGDPHSNGVMDSGETGIDCGGTIAMTSPCKAGQGCNTSDDCEAGCDTASHLCQEPSHTDGKISPTLDETDVDCGYPGKVCDPGKKCSTEMNCEGLCTNLLCAAPTHNDMRISPSIGETDVDCGGNTPDVNALASPACTTDQACALDRDCQGLCGTAMPKVCLAPTYTDNKKNGDETDVDCGGAAPNRCVTGQRCDPAMATRDCDSRVCLAGGTCDQRRASRKDGDESDVDCGGTGEMLVGVNGRWNGMRGTPAARCSDLSNPPKSCNSGTDCTSGFCQAVDKVCVAGRSCAGIENADTPGVGAEVAGLDSCGKRESTDATKVHESCCRSNPLPTTTTVRLDKYEVTAGRMRQFVEYVKRTQGGVPNVRAWATAEVANMASPIRARLIQGLTASTGTTFYNFLPDSMYGPMGLFWQLGGAAMDGKQPSGSQGCFNGLSSGGHATYWFKQEELAYFGATFPARPWTRTQYDEKSLNCLTYFMAAAFCAWDGGYLPTDAQSHEAWGTAVYPWGASYASPATATVPQAPAAGITNYELTVNNNNAQNGSLKLFYHYPGYGVENPVPPGPAGGYYDTVGYIAAPGRFPLDRSTRTSANGEVWFDLGANLFEMVQMNNGAPGSKFCDQSLGTGQGGTVDAACDDGPTKPGVSRGLVTISNWQGGSWEDHPIPNPYNAYRYPLHTQYGKTGTRCAR